jgi:hypothetical protein
MFFFHFSRVCVALNNKLKQVIRAKLRMEEVRSWDEKPWKASSAIIIIFFSFLFLFFCTSLSRDKANKTAVHSFTDNIDYECQGIGRKVGSCLAI